MHFERFDSKKTLPQIFLAFVCIALWAGQAQAVFTSQRFTTTSPGGTLQNLTTQAELVLLPGSLSLSMPSLMVGERLDIQARVQNQDTVVRNNIRVRFTCGSQQQDIFISLAPRQTQQVATSFNVAAPPGVQPVKVEVNPVHSELAEINYANNAQISRVVVQPKTSPAVTPALQAAPQALGPATGLSTAVPFPVLTGVVPDELEAGRSYTLTLQGNDLTTALQLDFGPGIRLTGALQSQGGGMPATPGMLAVPGNRTMILAPVTLDSTAAPGIRQVSIQRGAERRIQRPTVSVVAAPAKAPLTILPAGAPRQVAPGTRVTVPPPEEPAAVLSAMSPSRWQAGQSYEITVLGDRLGLVDDISFGQGIQIDQLQHQGEGRLTFSLTVAKDTPPGIRFAQISPRVEQAPNRLSGWVIKPAASRITRVPPLVWKARPVISLRQGAIYLQNPAWSYSGDVTTKHPVPQLNDETIFNWKEETPGLADQFEIRFMTKGGEVVHRKTINLLNPAVYITSFKPDSSFLAELFEKYAAAVRNGIRLQQLAPNNKGVTAKTAAMGLSNNSTDKTPVVKAGQVVAETASAGGFSLIPPVFMPTAQNVDPGSLHRLTPVETYIRDNAGVVNLLWQVVGYKRIAQQPGTPQQPVAATGNATTGRAQLGLQAGDSVAGIQPAAQSAPVQPTELVEIEVSEKWPLHLSGSWPTGVTCDAANQIDSLTPVWSHPGGVKPKDENHYPGDTLRLRGDFSIKNSPWAISAKTTYSTSAGDPPPGGGYPATPVISDESYQFNNIVVDWGDGSWNKLEARAIESELPGWSNADRMTFDQSHQYFYPALFQIRFYVVPQDQMGQIEAIVEAHRARPAGDGVAVSTEQSSNLLLAANALSASDAGPGYSLSQTGPAASAISLEMPGSRIFMLYCNPMTVTIVQDTAATGPLHLDAIEIVSFSSDAAPPASPVATRANPGRNGAPKAGSIINQAGKLADRQQSGQAVQIQAAPVVGSQPQLSAMNQAKPAFHLEDTKVSSCAGGLWARGQLRYFGQGYARIQWLVDDIVVSSRDIKVGPSELRRDLTLDPAAWGEPLLSDFMLDSPRLPVNDLGLHRVRLSARVIADPTWSAVNAISLKSSVRAIKSTAPASKGGTGKGSRATLPVVSGQGGLQPAFLPEPNEPQRTSWEVGSQELQAAFSEVSGPWLAGNLFIPPYAVISPEKKYLVEEPSEGALCRLDFPTKDGDFEIAGLADVREQSGSYSGKGLLIYKLPDGGPGSTTEHYLPIAFNNWQVPDGRRVQQGRLETTADEILGGLPGMQATLTRLEGDAGDRLLAFMNVTLKDKTIRLTGAEEPQSWPGVSSPLTPAGDWYAENLKLGRSLIGWSMTSIESNDVRLDLSSKQGDAPAGAFGSTGWVGINLGTATLYPYLFDLDEAPITVAGWSLTESGLSGHAVSSNFSHAFGDGTIGWNKLTIDAYKSAVTAKYDGLAIDMAWPKMRLEANNAHYSYSPGSDVDVQLGLDNLPLNTQAYDVLDMKLIPKSFSHMKDGWGLMADAELSFRDEQGGLFADGITINDLFFSIFSRAYYSGPTIPLSIKGQVGGADELISALDIGVGDENSHNKMTFDFTSEFSLEGMGRAEEPVHMVYGIDKLPGHDAEATGPEHPAEIVLRYNFPETNTLASNELRITYSHASAPTGTSGGRKFYASNDKYSNVMSDCGDGRLLLAGDIGVTGGGCGNDTFGGHVDTRMFGSQAPAIEGTFRFGETNGSKYWLTYFHGDNLHILVYAGIYIEMLHGGLAYNFAHDAFNHAGGFNACPSPGKGILFSSGLGLSIGGDGVVQADGILTVHPNDSFYEMLVHALLFQKANLNGRLRYYNSAFDGEIWGDVSLLESQLQINAPEHSCGVHVDSGAWKYFMGTKDNPVTGRLTSAVSGNTYLVLGSKEGLLVGANNNSYYERTAGGFGVKGTLYVGGEVGLTLNPLRFDGQLNGHIDGKFVNPVKDLGLGVGAHLGVGCCNPVKAGFGFSVSCCCVGGGADVYILPNPGFSPYAEWTCDLW